MVDVKNPIQGNPYLGLWNLIRRTINTLVQARQQEIKGYGISVETSGIFFAISILGKQAIQANIARHTGFQPHHLSQLITRMEKEGLVKRVKDLERRNLVRVEFTEKGRLLHLKLDDLKPVTQILSILDESERERLSYLLARLCKRINKWIGRKTSSFPFTHDGMVLRSTSSLQALSGQADMIISQPNRYALLWLLLKYTNTAMVKVRHGQAQKYGVSNIMPGVFYAVSILGRKAIQANIARYLAMKPHNLSILISKMEKDGLVRRVKDLDKKNQVRIELTSKGNDIFQKCDGQRPARTIISVLKDSEQEELWEMFAKLRDQTVRSLNLKDFLLYPPSDRKEFLKMITD